MNGMYKWQYKANYKDGTLGSRILRLRVCEFRIIEDRYNSTKRLKYKMTEITMPRYFYA